MLIRNDGDPVLGQPFLGLDLDVGNDGLDDAASDQFDWNDNWDILDAIGVFSEAGEAALGRTYAQVNFGPEIPGELVDIGLQDPIVFTPNIEPGATYVGLGYEIEYLGRWGNSTGQTPDDWHASNLTDKSGSGSSGLPDYRQPCVDGVGCHPVDDGDPTTPAPANTVAPESNQGVPYGTKLVNTLGAPNYMTGDFDGDGFVDSGDIAVWENTYGDAGTESNHPAADHDHNFSVNGLDFLLWQRNFGSPPGQSSGVFFTNSSLSPTTAITTIPEPTTLALSLLSLTFLSHYRRWR